MLNNKFGTIHLGMNYSEMDMAPKSMDKDRDDQYLTGQFGVTIPIYKISNRADTTREDATKKKFDELMLDGFNNIDRHPIIYKPLRNKLRITKYIRNNFAPDELQSNHIPSQTGKDITLGRSISSASTTSHSALSSSEAIVERH